MTLTNRLSVLFLLMLSVVLIGFSVTLLIFASVYLRGQASQQLEATINLLTAAAEIGSDSVEWEPEERKLIVPLSNNGRQLVWCVFDELGNLIDSSNSSAANDLVAARSKLETSGERKLLLKKNAETWQFSKVSVEPSPEKPALSGTARKHPRLIIIGGIRMDSIWAMERRLAMLLGTISLTIWSLTLLASRSVCRRALAPVTDMAAATRKMGGDNLAERLPVPASADEVEDLGHSFNTLLEKVEESFLQQQQFTREASHQLRTPLTVILGQLDVALRRDRSALEYRDTLTTVQRRATQLKKIVEALLYLARTDAEAQRPEFEAIDLSTWLPNHLSSWAGHPRYCAIQCEVANAPLNISAPPILFGQLVDILIENACKYSEPGSPITMSAFRQESQVFLEIADQGCGIDPEDFSKIFQPFFRSQRSRSEGIDGTGLGLAIASRLAATFGSQITLVSEIDKGSRFRLILVSGTTSSSTQ